MNIAIIGGGLIGNKRAKALQSFPDDHLLVVCDIDTVKAQESARRYSCEYEQYWQNVVKRSDIQVIINSAIKSFSIM